MKIAITGSTGLIGTALSSALSASGHDLVRLVRREPSGPGEARWDIEAGTIDTDTLQDVDAIVHLAGENIGLAEGRCARQHRRRGDCFGSRALAVALVRAG